MNIVCQNCQNQEPEGALFCTECGTKLIAEGGLSTASISATDSLILKPDQITAPVTAPHPIIEAQVSLHIVRTGQILPLVGRDEFTIGRVSEGQSILPDIDLTPYDAYSQGVSRLHTTVKLIGEEVYVEDLGSSNGTRVNNNRLQPHQNHPVNHGDVVSLGRFKIQVLVRQE